MWQETRRIFLESAGQELHAVARLLPRLAALVILLVLTVVLAGIARSLVRRTCERLSLDRRLRSWGFVTGPDGSVGPTRLLAQVSFWTLIVMGTFAGISVLDAPAATALAVRFLAYLPRLVVGAFLVGAGIGIAHVVERNVLIGAVNMGVQSARILAVGARWLVIIFGWAIALEEAGVAPTVVAVASGILLGGIVLALALAVGLGAKDMVARSLQRRFPDPGSAPGLGTPAPGHEEPQRPIQHL
jgi:hypothetical protein